MASCAMPGGCDNSKANGGRGCYLCDRIAKLPQPKWKIRSETGEAVRKSERNLTRIQSQKKKGEKL